jgi:hypothetical protein
MDIIGKIKLNNISDINNVIVLEIINDFLVTNIKNIKKIEKISNDTYLEYYLELTLNNDRYKIHDDIRNLSDKLDQFFVKCEFIIGKFLINNCEG